ncbi:hypothetical protein ABT390_21980 [Streptomyces aurantiacus]|uniref:hypothetical protein n=1 Tax=Streptomyces aurantiacus TaxID=47760 RepID=UPI00040ABDB1|nr:hypothetical protein [Streptomyces aurantiacus]
MTAEPVTETFAFACGDCGHVWEASFQVMFFTDPVGQNTQEYVDEAGKALRSPLADAVCPRCGGRKVHVMAPEFADRARAAEHADRPERHHLRLPHRHHDAPRGEPGDPPPS